MVNANQLKAAFRNAFPDAPKPRICRAPGRVNLIGEHIDYNGFPVLPMTIDRDIKIAYRARADSLVRIENLNPDFPPIEFQNEAAIPPSQTGAWENYCKAAIQGLNDRLKPKQGPGLSMLIASDLPAAAGLSSSSALVVACALAYLDALGIELGSGISRLALGTLLAESERYVGTHGGGMDQAVILNGSESSACKINFNPLRVEHVPLLVDYTFVICNSLVKADKSGAAQYRYNEGPFLSRLICALVEKQAQREFGDEIEFARLEELWSGPLCLTDREAQALFDATLPNERTTLAQAAAFLKIPESEIRKRWIGDLPEPANGFTLKARARHQLTEYQRVEHARDLLLLGNAEAFGHAMNASHASCRDDYGVSCPELDALVEAALESGSIGSRLTGAGFGGCTVNLVPTARLEVFHAGVRTRYYTNHPAQRSDSASIIDVKPSLAAGYITDTESNR